MVDIPADIGVDFVIEYYFISVSPFVFAIPKKFENDVNAIPWQGYEVNPLKAGVQLLKLQLEII